MDRSEFFGRIFRGSKGLIEIRCLPSGSQRFTRDFGEIEKVIGENRRENIFFGATTRNGQGGSKNHAFEVVSLWADLDFKEFIEGERMARRAIDAFPLKPSIIVNSGHGYHVYWLLTKPVRATLDIESYLKGIARALDGDRAAAEIARILRVPETINRKKNLPPVQARVVAANDYRYKLVQFRPWKTPKIFWRTLIQDSQTRSQK